MATAPQAAAGGAKRKLQLLCLHGHAQTAERYREKTGSIRGPIKKKVDFHFIDAPFEVAPCEFSNGAWAKSWLKDFSNPEDPFKGLEESIALVEEKIDELQIDGLVGFSQGSMLVSAIVAKRLERAGGEEKPDRDGATGDGGVAAGGESSAATITPQNDETEAAAGNEAEEHARSKGQDATPRALKFVAVFSGFLSRRDVGFAEWQRDVFRAVERDGDPLSESAKKEVLAVDDPNDKSVPSQLPPSYHCWGLADEVIEPQLSEELANLMHADMVFTHPGGHLVPSQAKATFVEFVKRFM